mmetsp:Transcript_29545/g.45014  ORF Transcript_29545/g.45014 Transcript_29545/m.45014 type:complete len:88 (+) Transcript_29545:2062-2325(+)
MFGEEDVINERKYTTSVRCTSTMATVFCVKAEEFFARFQRDDRTWKTITQRILKKDEETKKNIIKAAQRQNPNFLKNLSVSKNPNAS